jgi:hypothetical protein
VACEMEVGSGTSELWRSLFEMVFPGSYVLLPCTGCNVGPWRDYEDQKRCSGGMNAWSKSRGNEARELCGSGVKITEYDINTTLGRTLDCSGRETR